MPITLRSARCYNATPELLRKLLQDVTGVTLVSSREATIRNPTLGTVGGAGDPQPVVEHAFRFPGLRSTDLLEAVAASRRFPLTWRLSGREGQRIPVHGWRINRKEHEVTILAQPGAEAPRTLTAALQGGQRFTWPIQATTP